jgi:lipoate-protein ligase A
VAVTTNVTSGSGGDGRGDRPRRPDPLPASRSWTVERREGGAGSLFSDSEPAASRRVRVLSVDRPALVLGSTQRASVVGGVDVVRRRSGGGAVLLRPGETVWVDVSVPADDPLWAADVGRSFWWLGDVWASAVGGSVHRGPLVRTAWSDAVCFAGVGSGEVVVDGRRKVVGMASRRTRVGALFQCAVPLVWDPAAYVALLGLPPAALAALADVAAPPAGRTADDVVAAFLEELLAVP